MTATPAGRAGELRARIRTGHVVADGAMATVLLSRGVSANHGVDELNLSSPDLVRDVHREYAAAGAEIIESNTFGANRVRLAAFGLAERLADINRAGVRLARGAAGDTRCVAGAIGPLGMAIEPRGPMTRAHARAIFREQAAALMAEGVDLFVLETFSRLDELFEAVAGTRDAAGPVPIVIAHVTVDAAGRLPGGDTVETFARVMDGWEAADVIGVNCSVSPQGMLDVIDRMSRLTSKPLSAMPSAGLPAQVDGRTIYLHGPGDMAQCARRLVDAGVRIVGGCCGTTPEHIRAMARAAAAR